MKDSRDSFADLGRWILLGFSDIHFSHVKYSVNKQLTMNPDRCFHKECNCPEELRFCDFWKMWNAAEVASGDRRKGAEQDTGF
jgi:hypothetical protein